MAGKHIRTEIKKICRDVKMNVPMKLYTSVRIGGRCDFLVQPENIEELKNILFFAKENSIPYFILGNGTNILVGDKGIRGIVIKLNKFNRCEISKNRIFAQCGVSLPLLLNTAVKNNLSGLEFVYGIPGTVGGAIKSNAGTEKKGIGDALEEILVLNEKGEEVAKKDFVSSYRTPLVENGEIVLQGNFKLKKGDGAKIREKIKLLKEKRKKAQPQNVFSCGCVFKNPEGFSAGYLIDKSGAKGKRCGDVEVSSKHANFIINRGNATAKDFLNLAEKVKEMVKEKFNIDLEFEIKLVGEF